MWATSPKKRNAGILRFAQNDDFRLMVFGDSIQEAFGDAFVGVDAAVAEEGPVLAGDFDEFGVEVCDSDLFFVVAGFGEDAAEGVGDEAAAPELDAGCGGVVAGAVEFYGGGVAVGGESFEFDVAVLVAYRLMAQTKTPLAMAWARWAVCQASYWARPNSSFSEGCQPMAVGKKTTSAPRRAVRRAPWGTLLPADERADRALRGLGGFEAEVAGSEINFCSREGRRGYASCGRCRRCCRLFRW